MLLKVVLILFNFHLTSATDPEYHVLVLGEYANEGTVVLFNGTELYPLCYDGWDDENAAVVCRMIGYTSDGAIAVQSNATFGMTSYQYDCNGNEQLLQNCPVNVTECSMHGGVVCSKDPIPTDFFLLAMGSSIVRVDRFHEGLTVIKFDTSRYFFDIGYDFIEQEILWTDALLKQIAKCDFNGGEITIIYQSGNASAMHGIAVDSDSRLIFYTDAGYHEIGVVHADTLTRTVLINSSLDKPGKIIIDYNTRKIYWADWGENAMIERSNYDGSDREVLVSAGLINPNGLVLDGDLLYWCDADYGVIERIFRNGTGRTVIYTTGFAHCFDFVLVDDYFYCNDLNLTNIIKLAKDGSGYSAYGPPLPTRYGIVYYRKGNLTK
ncbi:low-density lipoprotein receptor-related protein 4-like [Ylistrum balloti]|uniref:low-density lipoprotein receptor-related protein 4-like n=1 Tax=Ylistrum balloti TaxID=509963 RepID=UPI0029059A4D|nr:low-density lipoprotein receptor-related protein 4-like [Ylistrum balloti]